MRNISLPILYQMSGVSICESKVFRLCSAPWLRSWATPTGVVRGSHTGVGCCGLGGRLDRGRMHFVDLAVQRRHLVVATVTRRGKTGSGGERGRADIAGVEISLKLIG